MLSSSGPTYQSLRRLLVTVVILLAAFWLRLHNLSVANLNLDEAWSYAHAASLIYSDIPATTVLAVEPNNALHLVLASVFMQDMPVSFGIRVLSLFAGFLSVAFVARLAFRLWGSDAALIALVLYGIAFGPLYYSQIARPYVLATMLALASVLFWLEQRWRLNLFFSILTPLAHIGAMPVIITQDVMTALAALRGKHIEARWIVNRACVYMMFALILLLVHLRRLDGKVMSSGQATPAIGQFLSHMKSVLVSNSPTEPGILISNWHEALFLIGFVLPVLLLLNRYLWRQQPRSQVALLGLWISITYMTLFAMTLISDGPIKFIHISHIAAPLVILAAGMLARIEKPGRLLAIGIFTLVSGVGILTHYERPYRYFTDTASQLADKHSNEETLYTQHLSAMWALQINEPSATYVAALPLNISERPHRYRLIGFLDFMPPIPNECNPEPVWEYGAFHLHDCNLSKTAVRRYTDR